MKNSLYQGKITELLALLVFGIFALCTALVLLTGAGIYRDLTHRGSENFESRTAAQYISTRVRQAGTVSVENFGGTEALTLREIIDGESYVTRVYCYDGGIRELFALENAGVSPENGEVILPAADVAFFLADGLLNVQITHSDGTGQELFLFVPLGKAVGP